VRSFRKAVEISIPILGMIVVFGGVLFISPTQLQLQMIVVLAGVLMIEAGVWGLTGAVLPNERQFVALREEGDRFIGLIRNLNAAKVGMLREESEQTSAAVQEALDAMHDSVRIMGDLAGQDD
jgi:Na+(H+)/acetate symporter ActP